MKFTLEFEKPIAELEAKIEELRRMAEPSGVNIADEISRLTSIADKQLRTVYSRLTAWQRVQIARHPERPQASDYISALFTDFTPMCGDRMFGDDAAIAAGIARFGGRPVMVISTVKGIDTETRMKHNFGMARPEGYRKALRLMRFASRFSLPILTFVDTPGAFPGIDAEARGQSEAIARSIEGCLEAAVPFVATIIGEGGSGGAMALATGDRVLMLENSVYSVISPEGCASILWRDASNASTAAEALRLTADDLLKLRLIDKVIPEPLGGAHRDRAETMRAVGATLETMLGQLDGIAPQTLLAQRREKFVAMGGALQSILAV